MRKVGPSLRRISEKTNADWLRRWIKSPRTFRPDTKMPHFYPGRNNLPEALKGTSQETSRTPKSTPSSPTSSTESGSLISKAPTSSARPPWPG